ncbi:MAG: hypothetical protein ABSC50_01830 [Candidatus Bathyarchaeia archaeon]
MRKRRLRRCLAVSTVIGNMLMILITLSLAAILVAWAGTSFGAFSGGSQLFFVQRGQALQERFVIENVFFNATSPNHNVMIFVRNVGLEDISIVAIYVNGNSGLAFASATWLCQGKTCSLPFALGVQQVVEFNLNWGSTWTSGTVFTIVVASARGNQAVATARGP